MNSLIYLHVHIDKCYDHVESIGTKYLIMAERQVTGEQEAPRTLSKNYKRLIFSIAFICISASVVIFAIVIFLRKDCPGCKQRSSIVAPALVILATLLLFLGVSLLTPLCVTRKQSSTPTPQVVVSTIPAEDLEKSPAPVLLYNHAPFLESYSIDLPDYFTAVQNTDESYVSAEADVCTKDALEIRPPCYEEALKMASTLSEAEST